MTLLRRLPVRKISVRWPSCWVITAWRENATRVLGRANLLNTRPVASAVRIRLAIDCTAMIAVAAWLWGYIAP
jgi:hypothetical protein